MRLKFGEEKRAFSIPRERQAFAESAKSAIGEFFEKRLPALNRGEAKSMAAEFMKAHQDRGIFRRAWHSLVGRPAGDAMMNGMFRALIREQAMQAQAGEIHVETSFSNHGTSAVAYVPLDRAMDFLRVYEHGSGLAPLAEEIGRQIGKARMSGEDPSQCEIPVKLSTQWRKLEDEGREAFQTVFRVGVGDSETVAVSGIEKRFEEEKDLKKSASKAKHGDFRDFEAAALFTGSRKMGSDTLSRVAEAGRKARSANRIKGFVMKGAVGAGMFKGAATVAAFSAMVAQAAAYNSMFGGAGLASAVMGAGTAAAVSGFGLIAAGVAGAAVMAKVLSKSRIIQSIGNMLSRDRKDNPVNVVLDGMREGEKRMRAETPGIRGAAPGMA